MGPLGVPEMIFIFVLALLVFGPKKLPELGRTFGKGMAEFRRASNELKSTFQTEMDNIERETKLKETASEIKTEVNKQISSSNYYDDIEDDYYKYDDTPSDSGASASKTKAASSTVETSTSPATDGDSSVASSNGQSAPAVASTEPKPAESSANADSETKAS